ncbi:MAG: type ISP restriction/modification enzyme [Promethearchaeota archaeon]
MQIFKEYIKTLQSIPFTEVTEYTHRTALQKLLENISLSVSKKIKILHEPKRKKDFGSPDFRIYIDSSIIGYVENKKISENLDNILKSSQIKKYKELSDNILLTNYHEWIWIKKGNAIKRETLFYVADLESRKAELDLQKVKSVEIIIQNFFSQSPKGVASAEDLAQSLAVRSRNLRDFLLEELIRQGHEHQEGRLWGLYNTFKTVVFSELTLKEFADAFSQMLCYSLFLAKLNADTKLVTLQNAKQFIPVSFELIKELVYFLEILEEEEYRETLWIVEEIVSVVNNLDLTAIQETLSFTKSKLSNNLLFAKDPYAYFYEDFLAAYDAKLRKSKGVYYTPPPVVNFIINSINDILKHIFGIDKGLADHRKVTVLDFATGTGTFLREILQQIFDTLPHYSGKRELIIKEHILKNLYGFEYLIAPYTIAYLKLTQFLKDNNYILQKKERLQIFLTNTLEPIEIQTNLLLPALSKEGKDAQEVKDKPILVITGNPPYNPHSRNKGVWITSKIEDYMIVDGKRLNEKNPKLLQDDYVKFIRFAQDKMDKVEEGVVGIITNHGFLDNPTFRGMRQSLMKSFNKLYFLDLHGNVNKKEKTPSGAKDENVFDIKQGVAISIMIKKKGLNNIVYHSDLWGLRSDKYKICLENSFDDLEWEEIKPDKPFYLFIKEDEKLKSKYYSYININDIFKIKSSGVTSSCNNIVVDFNEMELKNKILNKLSKLNFNFIKNYAFNPFSILKIYYDRNLVKRHRYSVMKYFLLFDNIGLILRRTAENTVNWQHSFIAKYIIDGNYLSARTYIIPIYIFRESDSFLNEQKIENFKESFRLFINNQYNNIYNPEQILGYIYAILHSLTYRIKYVEFLKRDFPRIPFIESQQCFEKLSVLGWDLVQAHLMNKIPKIKTHVGKNLGSYKVIGNNEVIKPEYKKSKLKNIGKLFINKTQYFDNVPKNVYEFYIGGYQVLDKYLKDRKKRKLSLDEIDNVENIVNVLAFTIEQMKRIDELTNVRGHNIPQCGVRRIPHLILLFSVMIFN